MVSSMASGWKPKTSSRMKSSSSVGLSMSSQKTVLGSRTAATRASGEASVLMEPSGFLMKARSIRQYYRHDRERRRGFVVMGPGGAGHRQNSILPVPPKGEGQIVGTG